MKARRLRPGDEADACRLVALAGFECAGKAVGAWLADDRHVMVGAWAGDDPAGLAWGYRLPRPDRASEMLLLYSIDVAEAHRGRGVGERLVEAMRREARAGVWLVTNESNAAAMALYAKTGGERRSDDDVLWTFPPLA